MPVDVCQAGTHISPTIYALLATYIVAQAEAGPSYQRPREKFFFLHYFAGVEWMVLNNVASTW